MGFQPFGQTLKIEPFTIQSAATEADFAAPPYSSFLHENRGLIAVL